MANAVVIVALLVILAIIGAGVYVAFLPQFLPGKDVCKTLQYESKNTYNWYCISKYGWQH